MTSDLIFIYTPDVARGDWIRERLGDWASIASVVPQGFEAYARVLHPVDAQLLRWEGDTPITVESASLRWRDVAARHGTVWHPLMQWSAIIHGHIDPGQGEAGWQYTDPALGQLPADQLAAVARVLGRHTVTPDACTTGLWEGYGWIQGGNAVSYFVADDVSRFHRARLRRRSRKPVPAAFSSRVLKSPRLELPGRTYLLFEGPLGAFDDATWAERSWGAAAEFWKASPNQLWPKDHAWFLASEIDFDSTVIGGTRALIDEVTRCDAIEAVEIPAGASLTQDADTIN